MTQSSQPGALTELLLDEDKVHRSLVPDDVVIRDYLSCINDDTWVRHAELVKLADLKETPHEELAKQDVLRTYIEERRRNPGEMPRDLVMEGILWQERFMEEYKKDQRSQDKTEAQNYKQSLLSTFRTKRSSPPAAIASAHRGSHGSQTRAIEYPTESAAESALKRPSTEELGVYATHPVQTTKPMETPHAPEAQQPDNHEIGDEAEQPTMPSAQPPASAHMPIPPGEDNQFQQELDEPAAPPPPVVAPVVHPEQPAQQSHSTHDEEQFERELDEPAAPVVAPVEHEQEPAQQSHSTHDEEQFERELDEPAAPVVAPVEHEQQPAQQSHSTHDEEQFERELDEPAAPVVAPVEHEQEPAQQSHSTHDEEQFERELDEPAAPAAPSAEQQQQPAGQSHSTTGDTDHAVDDPTKTTPQPIDESDQFAKELDDPEEKRPIETTQPSDNQGADGFDEI